MKEFIKKFANIQKQVNVEKNGYNGFGKYNYRTIDDMLSVIKPLLADAGMILYFNDEIVSMGKKCVLMTTFKESKYDTSTKKSYINYSQELKEVDRVILKTTITVTDGENQLTNSAYADIDPTASMSDEQKVGAASTYARKYALNGMFAIDDGKLDPDSGKLNPDSSENKPVYGNKSDESEKTTTKKSSSEVVKSKTAKTETAKTDDKVNKATIDKMVAEFAKIGIIESDVFKHIGLTRETVKNSDIPKLREFFLEQKELKEKAAEKAEKEAS